MAIFSAISVGTADLEDPGLICLKDAPLQEVRRRNEPKLRHKARQLRDIVLSLIASNKQVRPRLQYEYGGGGGG